MIGSVTGRSDRAEWVIVGVGFACLFALSTGLIYAVGEGSGPGARVAGSTVAGLALVGFVLSSRAAARRAAKAAKSEADARKVRLVIITAFVFVAVLMVPGPVLSIGLGVNGWIVGAVAVGLPIATLGVANSRLRRAGMDVAMAKPVAEWARRRWQLLLAVTVLLVGCYGPPITDTVWRRTVGVGAGLALFGLSLGYRRGWSGLGALAPSDPAEAAEDPWGPPTLGMLVGGVCAFAWATGIVFRG
jgi:hypothetical protein